MTLTRGVAAVQERREGCQHTPQCPTADAPDHDAAAVLDRHPEQGWSHLCNGVILWEDTGEILPTGQTVAPHRPDVPHHVDGAL